MDTFLQLLIAGIATGAIYALAAVGFALLWQTAGAINFAQGEFIMLAGFMILGAMKLFDVGVIPGFLIALPVILLVLGYLFKRLLVDPLLKHGEFSLVIATIGLGILLKEGVKTFVDANPLPFPPVVPEQVFQLGGVDISLKEIATLLIAATMIFALQFFLNHTFVGRSMEATAQNRDVARILGIDVDRMILYTFLLNAGLVAVAALLITPSYFAKFNNGEVLGLIAFMAAIVGGFNQVRGALIGGFLIGILDNLSAFYVSAAYRNAFPLILLIAVILFKPEGLFGRREERRL
jgi:branched-chain amino acid transport system permease protein